MLYKEFATAFLISKNRAAKIKHGRTSFEDDSCKGPPKMASTEENTVTVHNKVKVSQKGTIYIKNDKALCKVAAAFIKCISKIKEKTIFSPIFGSFCG